MSEQLPDLPPPARIRQLTQDVIERIAAAEVVQRPASCLKEVLENAYDSGANSITIEIEGGGFDLIQVTDDGCGIHFADLPLLAARFCTSKIREFSDIEDVSTFGFRGEALSSISHVAELSVLTSRGDSCAYSATYRDGQLAAPPTRAAAPRGTTLSVRNLFAQQPWRRLTLGGSSAAAEESRRLARVAGAYGLHRRGVGLSLRMPGRRRGAEGTEAHMPPSFTLRPEMSRADVFAVLFGEHLVDRTLEFSGTCPVGEAVVRWTGLTSTPQAAVDATTRTSDKGGQGACLIFVNDRLVEWRGLRDSLRDAMTQFTPRGARPCFYIAVTVPAGLIDVNYHPSKDEVFVSEAATVAAAASVSLTAALQGSTAKASTLTNMVQIVPSTGKSTFVPPPSRPGPTPAPRPRALTACTAAPPAPPPPAICKALIDDLVAHEHADLTAQIGASSLVGFVPPTMVLLQSGAALLCARLPPLLQLAWLRRIAEVGGKIVDVPHLDILDSIAGLAPPGDRAAVAAAAAAATAPEKCMMMARFGVRVEHLDGQPTVTGLYDTYVSDLLAVGCTLSVAPLALRLMAALNTDTAPERAVPVALSAAFAELSMNALQSGEFSEIWGRHTWLVAGGSYTEELITRGGVRKIVDQQKLDSMFERT